jgi:hypothetical protein
MTVRSALYTDQVQPRISVAMVRATLGRRRGASYDEVFLVDRKEAVRVTLVQVAGSGALETRTVFSCPRCAEAARVLGYYFSVGWGCRRCMRWRSRSAAQRRVARAT